MGLKHAHIADILDGAPDIGWFEIHAENYMRPGSPAHRDLSRIRERYPLSVHGVGLSIGGAGPLDEDHLARLKDVVARYRPGLVSEHLAWSSHGGRYYPDLLPLPYTPETMALVADHIDRVQEVLGRQMLLENPSSYVAFETSTIPETEFLAEIACRTGCGLLLDVNNVLVSAQNLGFSPAAYLGAFPLDAVGEIHLAGHAQDRDETGAPILIDAHDRPVAERVWALYRQVLAQTGALPTLIEWDNDVPALPTLMAECATVEAHLTDAPAATRAHPKMPESAGRSRACDADTAVAAHQAVFAAALGDPDRPAPPTIARRSGQAGAKRFDIYRNNVVMASIGALADSFPAVEALVGDAFFRAMARVFAAERPPHSAVFSEYGQGFPAFIEGFAPAVGVPYLADIAWLDWARLQAYHAPEAPVLPIEALAALPADSIGAAGLAAHPSVTVVRSRYPIGAIWADAMGQGADAPVDLRQPQSVVVLRHGTELETRLLPPGGAVFLDRLIAGASIDAACQAAGQAEPAFVLEDHLAGLFALGAFSALATREPGSV